MVLRLLDPNLAQNRLLSQVSVGGAGRSKDFPAAVSNKKGRKRNFARDGGQCPCSWMKVFKRTASRCQLPQKVHAGSGRSVGKIFRVPTKKMVPTTYSCTVVAA